MEPTPATPTPASTGFFDRILGAVASRPGLALAVIVILTVLLIGGFIYTQGYFGFGSPAASAAGSVAANPEIDRLIDTINAKA